MRIPRPSAVFLPVLFALTCSWCAFAKEPAPKVSYESARAEAEAAYEKGDCAACIKACEAAALHAQSWCLPEERRRVATTA